MANQEMPVIVRFSKEEFASLLGRHPDDQDLQHLGTLNVVLRSIDHMPEIVAHPALSQVPGASNALRDLTEQLRPLEAEVFKRLRSNPELAKQFIQDPVATLDKMNLLPGSARSDVEAAARILAPLFTAKP